MQIKVMPFLSKKGNRVGKGAIEFDANDGPLAGFQLVGFTICDDKDKGLYVMFPSSIVRQQDESTKLYYFLRPVNRPDGDNLLDKLQDAILDVYESMSSATFSNKPRMTVKSAPKPAQAEV